MGGHAVQIGSLGRSAGAELVQAAGAAEPAAQLGQPLAGSLHEAAELQLAPPRSRHPLAAGSRLLAAPHHRVTSS